MSYLIIAYNVSETSTEIFVVAKIMVDLYLLHAYILELFIVTFSSRYHLNLAHLKTFPF